MAYFLFVDESGSDLHNSPYAVLAGVAIEDRDLWNLIQDIQAAEIRYFGRRYSRGKEELKGKKILKKKVYRQARQLPPIPESERCVLAQSCLDEGSTAGKYEITALAQAKLAYVSELFNICSRFRCKAFASIVSRNAPFTLDNDYLRKDYAYLFERFFYFLEYLRTLCSGIIVFDDIEKSKNLLLVEQMDRYFKRTTKGRQQAGQIIPEPFFVHSDLTTGVQIADLIAYVVSWGFRTGEMTEPKRDELDNLVDQVCRLRYRAIREVGDNPNFVIWSFTGVITDLRPEDMQDG